jgi:hypothetical protein
MKQKKSKLPAVIKKKEIKPRGGSRPGSGRPIGAKTIISRTEFCDHLTKEQIDKIVKRIIQLAIEGNVDCLKFIVNHFYGTPVPKHNDNSENQQKINILIDC